MFMNIFRSDGRCIKLLKIMRLSIYLLLLATFSLSARGFSQNDIVSLDVKNENLTTIIKEIRRVSDYRFLFRVEEVNKYGKRDFKVEKANMEKVMSKLLKGTNLTYSVDNGIIVINPKETSSNKVLTDEKTIKGKVTDNKGKPLPGVTIVVKGTKVGVATDIDGKFLIKAKKGDILEFSFIGMKTLEHKVKSLKDITIVLEDKTESMDEVVVTGYHTIEKRKLSSSIQTVKGEKLRQDGVISVDKLLQGKITGLTVIGQSSTPGAAPKIRIRGSSSITGNREPIWVIDGIIQTDPIQIPTEQLNSLDKVNLIGNAISFLNPEDIESINVLKDASATAIYGTKAANGVIVITTKKGKKGPAKISYSSNFSIKQAPTYDDMYRMNSKERVEASEEMNRRGLVFSGDRPSNVGYEGLLMDFWNKSISESQFLDGVKELKEINTDWYDLLFRNSLSQQHNISVSGADDNTNYYFSAGYAEDNGTTMNVGLEKITALLKINTKINDKLNLGFHVNAGFTKNRRPHSSVDLNQYAYNTSRSIRAYDKDGEPNFYHWGRGSEGVLDYSIFNELDNSFSEINNQNFSIKINADWKICKGLRYRGLFNFSKGASKQEEFANEKTYYISEIRNLAYGQKISLANEEAYLAQVNKCPFGGEMKTKTNSTSSYLVRNSLSYVKSFDKHLLSANIGLEINSTRYDGMSYIQRGYMHSKGMKVADIDFEKYIAFANWVSSNPAVYKDNTHNILSSYGTFNYSFSNKYSINFNIRTDGSNKFGQCKENKFLPVWSISGRWNIQEESIFKNIEWLNMFSVRASYGIQGNVHPDQVPNLIVRTGKLNGVTEEFESELYKFPNDNLRWEKTTSYDLGLDFAILNNKIFGVVDLYKKKGRDQIIQRVVSQTTGAEKVFINSGDIENYGWEVSLNFNPIQSKDYSLSFSFNTSKNYNKIMDSGISNYTYEDYLNGTLIKEGKSINSFYSYQFDGLDENGYPTFKNIIEEKEDTEQSMFNKVFIYSGKRVPDLSGGFSTNFRYKRFSINGLFAFSLGGKVRLNDLYLDDYQRLPSPQQNMSSDFVNRWKEKGDEEHTDIPCLSDKSLRLPTRRIRYTIGNNKWQMYNQSDLRVVSSDFLRLKNISLSYSFKKDFCKKLNVSNMSLHASMDNVFVLQDSKLKGRDPEQMKLGLGVIPPMKTFNVGFHVTF